MLRFFEPRNSVFTAEQKKWLVTNCINLRPMEARRAFIRHFGIMNHNAAPHPRRFKTLFDVFQRNGSVHKAAPTGRLRTARTPENAEAVQELLEEDPHLSQKEVGAELDLSVSSVNRIIKKDIKFYPYRPKTTTHLEATHKV